MVPYVPIVSAPTSFLPRVTGEDEGGGSNTWNNWNPWNEWNPSDEGARDAL